MGAYRVAFCGLVWASAFLTLARADEAKPQNDEPAAKKTTGSWWPWGGTAASDKSGTDKTSGLEGKWHQLINVTIPTDSGIRKAPNINHPPRLYVIVRKNGRQLGSYSTTRDGWEVDYEVDPKNQWLISEDPQARYTIEIWDEQWGPDDLVLSITGLKGEQFNKVIYEKGPRGLSPDRLTRIEFHRVDDDKQIDKAAGAK